MGSGTLLSVVLSSSPRPRLGFYDTCKRVFGATDPSNPSFFWKNTLAALACGVSGAWAGSPFFLLKVRLQAQTSSPGLAVGFQHNYGGIRDAVSHIYKDEGVAGFWRGGTTQMLRVGVGSIAQLVTYDYARHFISLNEWFSKHPGYLPFAASLVAGVALVIAMNPVDVVATRLYNQEVKKHTGALYKGPIDCITKIFRHEGPLAFYKGLFAHYLRVGPHTIATFVFWDMAKNWTKKLDRFASER